ncbi:MAG TPA: hypothetical protein VGH16_12425 [Candidatus Binatia bacterium]|jgi:hypothetical protein
MKTKFFPSLIFAAAALAAGGTGVFFSSGPAQAIVGMPLTPMSYAGAARRTARREVAYAGAAAATATAAAATTAAVATTAAAAATVAALPGGCVSAPPYFNCGGVMYQPAYQGGSLVYVVVR